MISTQHPASALKVAVAKYTIDAPTDFDAFARKQAQWLDEAQRAGRAHRGTCRSICRWSWRATFDDATRGDLHASLAATQRHHADWIALFSRLARERDLHIVAGTFLLDTGRGRGRYRNRSYAFSPEGTHMWQDKLRLTGFEKRTGVIESGDELKVFEADGVRSAIAVCYDSEFPLPVRAQCEAGARLLIVPSCTDTEAGATRVRVGCLARALENRCFVAQSVTAGEAPWSPALDVNTGEAALIAPMDVGLPHDGMVVQTRGDQHWAVATLDFAALEASRMHAQVANDRDWSAQYFPSVARAKVVRAA